MIVQIPEHPNPPMECPRCGKRTIVQDGSSIYTCLNCHFRKDVSQANTEAPSIWALLMIMVIVLLLI